MQLFRKSIFGVAILMTVSVFAADSIQRTEANSGNLIMEDIPVIPDAIINDLNQFQNVRSASFRDWTENGRGVYISTRFADVNQIHRVDMPGGARQQITFFKEPVGGVSRQPGGRNLIFTRDTGGSELSQIFMLDPADGSTKLLTDGESRNGATVWDRQGRRLAYQSTRRNGASNDVWLMDPMDPASSVMILESPDGTWWGPAEFSESGSKLLISNYVSIADSRVYLLHLDSRQKKLMAGGTEKASANIPLGFDKDEGGFFFVTDQGSEFKQLAWQSLESGAEAEIITADIPWDVNSADISYDRRRIAFAVNENGMSRLYLLDTKTKKYRSVDNIPTGLVFGLDFSPDDRYLGMTLNTARTPSDTFVLELGDGPLEYVQLVRWTTSEVGGLDSSTFQTPELIEYPTFDNDGDSPRQIPAWLYKPRGAGPFPVVVSIHGGPEGQSRPSFSSTYQMWVEKLGVAVVIPNVRGSSGYGKSYLSLDNGFRREDSVRDIGALLDWIATQPDLDKERVAVFGGSYGGYMVLASAFNYSDKLKAAVDIVGISNFVTFLENTQDYRRDLRRVEYGDERVPAMRAYLEKISPLNNVEKIAIPMLIVQGENDPRVPVTESKQVVEALRSQGQIVWFMNALNEGHGYRKKENRDIYQQVTVLFLQQHLIGED